MGISIRSSQRFQQFVKVVTSNSSKFRRPAQFRPVSKLRSTSPADPSGAKPDCQQHNQLRVNKRHMEAAENSERRLRMPLAEVVTDCVNRWFQDTLKEAKAGDSAMQVLVGQMYYSGYGVARDAQRGRMWVGRAAKSRSSVWKVGNKHPGYNASDSDSDDTKEDAK